MNEKTKRVVAIDLRQRMRMSVDEISDELDTPKTTVYGWVRDYPLSSEERSERLRANAANTWRKIKQNPRSIVRPPRIVTPFDTGSETPMSMLRESALGSAITWFLARGHVASLPITQASYDLVVDSRFGLKKIQIKTTNTKTLGERWTVKITKQIYCSDMKPNANGKRKAVAYEEGEVDLFFVVCGDGSRYLVPYDATRDLTSITLDDKYVEYKLP